MALARRLGRAAAALALLLAAASAHAEIWVFVDDQSATHFADHQIDRRYELFYRGTTGLTASSSARPLGAVYVPAVSARFDVSTSYKAVHHHIREAAQTYGLDVELLKAVIATESAFNTRAVSPKGAVGLMQLMPKTAQRFGVHAKADQTVQQRLTDPRTNVQAGARYLAWLLQTFNGELELAIAAYNAGEGAVLRAGRKVPNYPETLDYVRKVTRLHQDLQPPKAVIRLRASGARPSGTLPASAMRQPLAPAL